MMRWPSVRARRGFVMRSVCSCQLAGYRVAGGTDGPGDLRRGRTCRRSRSVRNPEQTTVRSSRCVLRAAALCAVVRNVPATPQTAPADHWRIRTISIARESHFGRTGQRPASGREFGLTCPNAPHVQNAFRCRGDKLMTLAYT